MLIGYVSDDSYVGVADVALEFTNGRDDSWEGRSRASGAIYIDLPPDDILPRKSQQLTGAGARLPVIAVVVSDENRIRRMMDDGAQEELKKILSVKQEAVAVLMGLLQ